VPPFFALQGRKRDVPTILVNLIASVVAPAVVRTRRRVLTRVRVSLAVAGVAPPAVHVLMLYDRQVRPECRVLDRVPLALGVDPALRGQRVVPGHPGGHLRADQRRGGAEEPEKSKGVGIGVHCCSWLVWVCCVIGIVAVGSALRRWWIEPDSES
jgi:hypothetical protein